MRAAWWLVEASRSALRIGLFGSAIENTPHVFGQQRYFLARIAVTSFIIDAVTPNHMLWKDGSMNSFSDLAHERYSLRDFDERAVEQAKIETIIEAARCAPSAGNRQPWRISVIDDPKMLEALDSCTRFRFGAPLAFVMCNDPRVEWKHATLGGYGRTDVMIALTQMMLQAEDLGLGTLIVAGFNEDNLRQAVGIPEELEPVSILMVGYAKPGAVAHRMHYTRYTSVDFVYRNGFEVH